MTDLTLRGKDIVISLRLLRELEPTIILGESIVLENLSGWVCDRKPAIIVTQYWEINWDKRKTHREYRFNVLTLSARMPCVCLHARVQRVTQIHTRARDTPGKSVYRMPGSQATWYLCRFPCRGATCIFDSPLLQRMRVALNLVNPMSLWRGCLKIATGYDRYIYTRARE